MIERGTTKGSGSGRRVAQPDVAASLAVSTRSYFWKPALALFHAVELEAYAGADVRIEHPVLDLGSGTGVFGAMLEARGIVEGVDLALEPSRERVRRVPRHMRAHPLQADARDLPLKDGSIRSIICNQVLCSIRGNVDVALAEARRVLGEGGLLLLTLPVGEDARDHPLPRLLGRIAGPRTAQRAAERIARRLDVHSNLDRAEWLGRIGAQGFDIERWQPFLTPRQALWAHFLNVHVLRLLGLLRLPGLDRLEGPLARLESVLLRPLLRSNGGRRESKEARCVLILARKTGVRKAREAGRPRSGYREHGPQPVVGGTTLELVTSSMSSTRSSQPS